MVGEVMLQHIAGGTTPTRRTITQEMAVSPQGALGRFQALMGDMWATTTTAQRRQLWRRFSQWTARQGLPMDPDAAVLFVMATGVKVQGQLAYSKAMAGSFKHLGIPRQPLYSLTSALRAVGADIPEHQATPMPKEVLIPWAYGQEPEVCLTALLAWKSCSRWGEVYMLASEQFLVVEDNEVIVDWNVTPKGKRGAPFKPSKYVVIRGDLTAEIARLVRSLQPFSQLCRLSTDAVAKRWGRTLGMEEYSGHSIKRGAYTVLTQLMAAGTLKVPGCLVSRVLKHEERGGERTVSDVTLKYGGDPVAQARMLLTWEVTQHL
ncbi:hypothetical protein DIPPA_20898 [Diplonema papillatum]|nr:hypothetical protein DIPPA_20898 [Diplonema papillatum]|eukprot:gene6902-biopygen6873